MAWKARVGWICAFTLQWLALPPALSLTAAMLGAISGWTTTLSLIFGGCCSNAITLEQLASHYSQSGTLITFVQFLLISLYGLPKHIIWTPYGPRFKSRRIPMPPYLAQVVLFYLVSLLNNAAFAYHIPLAVHIIFRSGGLIVGMVLGWLVYGKSYTFTQISSVLIVTTGIILTTLSSQPTHNPFASSGEPLIYATGIGLLSVALILSGFLGLVQDWTYSTYGRPPLNKPPQSSADARPSHPTWHESIFYLHFLALPMFIPLFPSLASQLRTINEGPQTTFSILFPPSISTFKKSTAISSPAMYLPVSLIMSTTGTMEVSLPEAYIPLMINSLTQVLCVTGVHRLTTQVTALTVTLVLSVRKALSFVLSVLGPRVLLGGAISRGREVHMGTMWTGAGLVLVGTLGYSLETVRDVQPGGKEKTV